MWTQEYLRYRVNACGHVAASQKVIDQIDGRGIAAACNADLSGVWIGEITDYFNNPFVMDLLQTGNSLSGTYKDKNDEGYVSGAVTGDRVEMRVGFGDTGFLVDARWVDTDVVNGNFRIGFGIGNRSFEMRRQR